MLIGSSCYSINPLFSVVFIPFLVSTLAEDVVDVLYLNLMYAIVGAIWMW